MAPPKLGKKAASAVSTEKKDKKPRQEKKPEKEKIKTEWEKDLEAHAITYPNTSAFAYFDKKVLPEPCTADKKKINERCQEESEDKKKKRLASKPGLFGKMKIPTKPVKVKSVENPDPAGWIDDHCEFLNIKPSSPADMFAQLSSIPDQLAKDLVTNAEIPLKTAEASLKTATQKHAAKMAKSAKSKPAAGRVRGRSGVDGAALFEAGKIIYDLYEEKKSGEGISKLQNEIEKAKQVLDKGKKEISDLSRKIEGYRNESGKHKGEINEGELVSDIMSEAVETNPCINVRRCSLVPYGRVSSPNGDGCCPGQTGHHVLPDAMFKGCTGYTHGGALTICVEGVNQYHASHGKMHTALENELKKLRRVDGQKVEVGERFPREDAFKAAAESITKTFPSAGCSAECIKAQLRENYLKVQCEPKNVSGLPSPKKPAEVIKVVTGR